MQVFAAPKAGLGMDRLRVVNRVALSACLLLTISIGTQRAKAVGDTRTLSLHHVHTNEDLTITYKKNGQYDEEALKKINWIMRDWRKNEAVEMDREEIDLLWQVYQDVGAKEAIHIICGYRAAATNEMLRNRSKRSGVARHSQHTLGKAIDFYIPGVPLDVLRAAAMKAQGGGVGFYPTSGSPFVHLDIGNVRAWPRMTREQLVKLFPDGRTVHLPPDGNPLPGYELAKADLENGRGATMFATPKRKSLLAALFGTDKDAEEADDAAAAKETAAAKSVAAKSASPANARVQVASADSAAAPVSAAPVQAAPAQPAAVQTASVPLPRSRPTAQIAAAERRTAPQTPAPILAAAPAAEAPAPIVLASLPPSPQDNIASRGLWDGLTDAAPQAATAAVLDVSAVHRRLAASMTAARTDTTATVGPFARPAAPQGPALAYADTSAQDAQALRSTTGKGTASVVGKAVDTATSRPAFERLNDPWMRGLMLTATVQNSLVVTRIGDPDYAGLATYMRKPNSALAMTFSSDPYSGISADQFRGSAVVFPPTVTFGPNRRTAQVQ